MESNNGKGITHKDADEGKIVISDEPNEVLDNPIKDNLKLKIADVTRLSEEKEDLEQKMEKSKSEHSIDEADAKVKV